MEAAPREMDVTGLVAALEELGLGRVAVEGSNVSMSPYRYVYVYLSDQDIEGPHLLLSAEAEFEDGDGIFMGAYADYEADGNVETYPDIAAVIAAAPERVEEVTG